MMKFPSKSNTGKGYLNNSNLNRSPPFKGIKKCFLLKGKKPRKDYYCPTLKGDKQKSHYQTVGCGDAESMEYT